MFYFYNRVVTSLIDPPQSALHFVWSESLTCKWSFECFDCFKWFNIFSSWDCYFIFLNGIQLGRVMLSRLQWNQLSDSAAGSTVLLPLIWIDLEDELTWQLYQMGILNALNTFRIFLLSDNFRLDVVSLHCRLQQITLLNSLV